MIVPLDLEILRGGLMPWFASVTPRCPEEKTLWPCIRPISQKQVATEFVSQSGGATRHPTLPEVRSVSHSQKTSQPLRMKAAPNKGAPRENVLRKMMVFWVSLAQCGQSGLVSKIFLLSNAQANEWDQPCQAIIPPTTLRRSKSPTSL